MSENSLFLRSATTEVEIWPARGGSIGQFVSTTPVGDWCWLVSDHDLGVACFPLVPFASRIRASAFDFDGRRVTLPPNNPPEPHAIHGHGWQTPWQVLDAARDSARLGYRHEADAWPWSYEAQQRFRLQEACLEVELLVRNASPHPMPLGMGLHPYFPLTPETHLEAKVSTVWRMDEELLPLALDPLPDALDLRRGQVLSGANLDHVFAGWSHHARITWPERNLGLCLDADALFENLVVYAPPGANFCCVEPVSNAADGFNLRAQGNAHHGVRVLLPGATMRGAIRFQPWW